MSKDETAGLLKFLSPFSEDILEIVFWLREFVWDMYPNCNELIYDNYNAVAFGWSPSDKVGDTFCSIAVGRSSASLWMKLRRRQRQLRRRFAASAYATSSTR